ncbi:type II secretion system minor pseudopilin GspI [Pseudomonas aeruginosa]|uniref:Type II secretion system protein I n=5 Tax=Pseudomonas aeruginosa TaxID=287 RepID=A0A6A9K4Q7_PSEAI|nr:type II secretion system minor pseudopilin GspI [Pseudomonas aeruginosa]OFR43986.1 type II secretion system protein GspI [Pseudomonas sp. HMSC066A08]MBG6712630.1 type II secretion system minor pseudopilin GspI [Pseudomonas aeruginosa]MBG7425293.1 type II secretion system minor pseudopilin GspI [Pseudomonas aeruginosa]MBG7458995.1 type II secretion system minor pseudopilin GspI [Pseudomonas aeruginosa]
MRCPATVSRRSALKPCEIRRQRGFTLLEVMVALAIFAILSVALYSAAQHIAGNSAGLTERSLAQWLADNRLNELRAGMRPLDNGRSQETLAFGGRDWLLACNVEAAPDPRLRKVSVEVSLSGAHPIRRAVLVGFVAAQP